MCTGREFHVTGLAIWFHAASLLVYVLVAEKDTSNLHLMCLHRGSTISHHCCLLFRAFRAHDIFQTITHTIDLRIDISYY